MLDHLRYFQAVARCGSLSAAARALQISQPGLTAVIKQLEESFGTRLLVRLLLGAMNALLDRPDSEPREHLVATILFMIGLR